jgi:nucleotidyltransferase substrate binding protein (TIGR01987 family)
MSSQDIRWIQRFNNFIKALSQLEEAVRLARQRPLTKLEEQGLIQAFEFTHELAWKTLKDFLDSRGVQDLYGSKDVTRTAFQTGLIVNGEAWMGMIQSRNLTTHTYDKATAAQIASAILNIYYGEFEKLRIKMDELKQDEGEA